MVVAVFVGVVIVPDPPIKVQSPAPAVGVFAAIVAPELIHTVWFGPAAATEGGALIVKVTFEVDDVQGGLSIDHIKTVTPGVNPVTVVFRTNGFVIVPDPETKVHEPVPTAGAFPARVAVADPDIAQSVWLGTALAIVGAALPSITILS
jgi:hypothetical protein